MRAGRLLAITISLQSKRTMTAQSLAKRFEVSRHTIYRDLDELSAAGAPIRTDRGVGGGISLLDDYRTDLSGLTPEEAAAFMQHDLPRPAAGGQLKPPVVMFLVARLLSSRSQPGQLLPLHGGLRPRRHRLYRKRPIRVSRLRHRLRKGGDEEEQEKRYCVPKAVGRIPWVAVPHGTPPLFRASASRAGDFRAAAAALRPTPAAAKLNYDKNSLC